MVHPRECANHWGDCECSEGNIWGLWVVILFLFHSLAPGSTLVHFQILWRTSTVLLQCGDLLETFQLQNKSSLEYWSFQRVCNEQDNDSCDGLGDEMIFWPVLNRRSRLQMCWGGSSSPHYQRAGMSWQQRTALLANCSGVTLGSHKHKHHSGRVVGWTKAALSWAGPEPPAAQAQLSAAPSGEQECGSQHSSAQVAGLMSCSHNWLYVMDSWIFWDS